MRRSAPLVLALAVLLAGCEAGHRPVRATSSRPAVVTTHVLPEATRIDAYLSGLAARGRLSATVLVARHGRRFAKAYGAADRSTHAANTLDTMYRLGSVTKQFTAMAILLLQQQRRLDVHDRVCRYVDRCPPAWADITIDELLTHTSGIRDYLGELGAGWPPRPVTPPSLVEEFRAAPLNFPPGTRMRYSNSGYALLGYVIERVTHETYSDFLQRAVFDPLAMTRTGFDTTDIRPGHAVGYYADGRLPEPYPMSALYSAGALYSTVGDLQRWDDALDSDTLLPAAAMRLMLRAHVRCPPRGSAGGCLLPSDVGYGYGWFVAQEAQGTLDHHVGRIDGFISYNGLYPTGDLHVIILSNCENIDILGVARAVAAMT